MAKTLKPAKPVAPALLREPYVEKSSRVVLSFARKAVNASILYFRARDCFTEALASGGKALFAVQGCAESLITHQAEAQAYGHALVVLRNPVSDGQPATFAERLERLVRHADNEIERAARYGASSSTCAFHNATENAHTKANAGAWIEIRSEIRYTLKDVAKGEFVDDLGAMTSEDKARVELALNVACGSASPVGGVKTLAEAFGKGGA